MFILILPIGLLFGYLAAKMQERRGRSKGAGWFWGLMIGPFALLWILISGSAATCPYCRSGIHPRAIRCPKCQADLSPCPGEPDPMQRVEVPVPAPKPRPANPPEDDPFLKAGRWPRNPSG